MEKIYQYLYILTIYLILALPSSLLGGCVPVTREELAVSPTATTFKNDDEGAETPPPATAVKNNEEETETPPPATATAAVVEEESELTPENSVRVVDPGIPFAIGFDETVHLADSTADITFTAIIQDGRCPEDGACFWEGEGEIQFLLKSTETGNTDFILKIPGLVETPYKNNPFVAVAGFQFQLLQLDPYPTDEDPPQSSEYHALLLFVQ